MGACAPSRNLRPNSSSGLPTAACLPKLRFRDQPRPSTTTGTCEANNQRKTTTAHMPTLTIRLSYLAKFAMWGSVTMGLVSLDK